MIDQILNSNGKLTKIKYPSNIYAVRIKDENKNIFDISIQHNGYCPDCYTERDRSRFNDYLSNLQYSAIDEYFKSINIKKPKVYFSEIEIITNSLGEIYHFSRSVN